MCVLPSRKKVKIEKNAIMQTAYTNIQIFLLLKPSCDHFIWAKL